MRKLFKIAKLNVKKRQGKLYILKYIKKWKCRANAE